MENNEEIREHDIDDILKEFGEETQENAEEMSAGPEAVEATAEQPVQQPKKKRNVKKVLLICLISFLSVVLLTVAAGFLYIDYIFGQLAEDPSGDTWFTGDPNWSEPTDFWTDPPATTDTTLPSMPTTNGGTNPTEPIDPTGTTDPTEPTIPTIPTEPTVPPTTVPPTFPSVPPIHADTINIMLLGADDSGMRTDSMILCTINTQKKTIQLTSFLRDFLVTIPGKSENTGRLYKLNSAYAYGGRKLLEETLLYNFGLKVDEFVYIKMNKFPQLVDIVGGVDINLTQAEADWFHKQTSWKVSAGVNHLNGRQALFYARIRKLDWDPNRTMRQQKVLEAIFNAYKDKNVFELFGMMNKILDANLISTTMTKDELWGYAYDMFPMISGFQLKRRTEFVNNWYKSADWDKGKALWENATYKGESVKIFDQDAVRKYLEDILKP